MKRISFILGLSLCACATTYSGKPTLKFQDFKYESVEGKAWPSDTVSLPEAANRYGLARPPKLHFVELNPNGERTLLFVHGLGSYLKFWRYQLDDFAAQGYRVLAIDMLGYGKSDKPATFPYTMEAMGDVVREFIKLLDAERVTLVGHSMGGQTALSFAIRYPEELEALVLTAPAGFEKFSVREKAWFKKVFSVALIKSSNEGAIWNSIRRNNFYRWKSDYEWLIEERVRVIKDPAFERYAYANVRSVQGLVHTDFVRANLHRIKVPTLIVHGDMDRLIPNPFMHGDRTVNIMRYGKKRIKGSKLVTLEGCGHTIQIDCHEDYNEAVKVFLEQRLSP